MIQEFTVAGMTCQGCVAALDRAIKRVLPREATSIDLATGRVALAGGASEDAIRQAVEAAGFELASIGRPDPHPQA